MPRTNDACAQSGHCSAGFFLVEDLTLKGLATKMLELIPSGPGEGPSDDDAVLDEALTDNAGEPDLVAAS